MEEELPLLAEGEARGQVVERPHAPVRRPAANVLAAQSGVEVEFWSDLRQI